MITFKKYMQELAEATQSQHLNRYDPDYPQRGTYDWPQNYTFKREDLEKPTTTADQLMRASRDSRHRIRTTVAKHPNATAEILSKSVKDPSFVIRSLAYMNPNATESHIKYGLNDSDNYARESAIQTAKERFPHLLKSNIRK